MDRADGAPRRWSLRAAALVFLVFAGLTLSLALGHAAWRDEADAWLVARDASIEEIVGLGRYTGSPALWYALLLPFAKLGLPFVTLHLVNWALAAAAIGLLVFRSPFPLLVRASIPFSYLFSYEYAVVARSYALAVLLAFAAAEMDRRRSERPLVYGGLLAMLCQANVHGLLIALPFIVLFTVEAVRIRPPRPGLSAGAGLAVTGLLVAIAQVIPAADSQATVLDNAWRVRPELISLSLSRGLFQQWGTRWELLAVAVLVAVGASLWRDRRALLVLASGVLGLESLFVLVYGGSLRHWGFLTVCALVALWISMGAEGAGTSGAWVRHLGTGAVALTALISVRAAVGTWRAEWTTDLSGSRAMAEFIKVNDLTGVPVAAHPWNAAAVLAYLPVRQFYYPGIDAWGSHMWWDAAMVEGKKADWDEVLHRIAERFGDHDVLLLANQPVEGAADHGFTMLHAVTESRRRDERFFLYRRTTPSGGPQP